MAAYEIYPICAGVFEHAEQSNFTYHNGAGTKLKAPILMYLVRGHGHNILVDTGPSDSAWAARYHHPMIQTEEMKPVNAVKNLGVEPRDVDVIINTHLHWDHCFNNGDFPDAKIYVQKAELQYAVAPLPIHGQFYESAIVGMQPRWVNDLPRIIPLDGDHTLFGGIEILLLPGHSPGFQGVLVTGKTGKFIITGDAVPLAANWEGNPVYGKIPPGIHVDLAQAYASLRRIEDTGAMPLHGHEAAVLNHAMLT